ncbi:hypothetical protein [Prevotella sp. 10(H)]|uniref:hypothetical protein n=1 Tax=Prevotella sp. 10(H) TaxID=1158294 RepID=UPI0004A6B2AA|nr:hypothetical protein [Prevotella sp. 10(H)]
MKNTFYIIFFFLLLIINSCSSKQGETKSNQPLDILSIRIDSLDNIYDSFWRNEALIYKYWNKDKKEKEEYEPLLLRAFNDKKDTVFFKVDNKRWLPLDSLYLYRKLSEESTTKGKIEYCFNLMSEYSIHSIWNDSLENALHISYNKNLYINIKDTSHYQYRERLLHIQYNWWKMEKENAE